MTIAIALDTAGRNAPSQGRGSDPMTTFEALRRESRRPARGGIVAFSLAEPKGLFQPHVYHFDMPALTELSLSEWKAQDTLSAALVDSGSGGLFAILPDPGDDLAPVAVRSHRADAGYFYSASDPVALSADARRALEVASWQAGLPVSGNDAVLVSRVQSQLFNDMSRYFADVVSAITGYRRARIATSTRDGWIAIPYGTDASDLTCITAAGAGSWMDIQGTYGGSTIVEILPPLSLDDLQLDPEQRLAMAWIENDPGPNLSQDWMRTLRGRANVPGGDHRPGLS